MMMTSLELTNFRARSRVTSLCRHVLLYAHSRGACRAARAISMTMLVIEFVLLGLLARLKMAITLSQAMTANFL